MAIGGGIQISVVFALVGILQAVAPVVAQLHGAKRDGEVADTVIVREVAADWPNSLVTTSVNCTVSFALTPGGASSEERVGLTAPQAAPSR